MYTNVLLPVDESIRTNELITDEAERLVSNTNNDITIHTIYIKDIQYDPDSTPKPIREFNDRSEKWSDEVDHVTTETEVLEGHTSTKISEYAHDNDIDLIIMAKQSRSKIKEFIYGSTTKETIKKTQCPVLVINKE